jgi:hypothetical protein
MKFDEIFALVVRVFGLVFLYKGLSTFPTAIQLIFFSGRIGNLVVGVLTVGWPLLVAAWLLRGAPLLMNLAYPDRGGRSEGSVPFGKAA